MLAKEDCTTKSHKDNQLEDFYAGVVCAEIGAPKSFITGCTFRYVDYPDVLLNKICPDYTGGETDTTPLLFMTALYWRIVYEFSPDVKRLSNLLATHMGSDAAKDVLLENLKPIKGDIILESGTVEEILDELDSLRAASITQAEVITTFQSDFDS